MGSKIELTGNTLTCEEVARVARHGKAVTLHPEAMERMRAARAFVLEQAGRGPSVYGFTTGVGLNKDQAVTADQFTAYNHSLIVSHCDGIGPFESHENVRAIMLARLNSLLLGYTGAQPRIAELLAAFLEHHIHPTLPRRGSVGEADITCLSYLGLALIGQGPVDYRGHRRLSSDVMDALGIEPLVLGPKDGLAIVSSNALASGPAALLLDDLAALVDTADIVYALSMEGFKANVSPIDREVCRVRRQPGHIESVEYLLRILEGSYLFDPTLERALQDPLSLRCAGQVHGSVRDALAYATRYLELQLNGCEDNPCVLVDQRRMLSTGNFESTTWVLALEMLGVALSHLSRMSCYRTVRLDTPSFTGLPRFLSPSRHVLAYATIQKTFSSLDTEIRHLSNPASADFLPLAGDIEDHANNGRLVVEKTTRIVDNLWYILGIEAMHACQAIDLRPGIGQGRGTAAAHAVFRQVVPFLEEDRVLTYDIRAAYRALRDGSLRRAVHQAVGVPLDAEGAARDLETGRPLA
jgi:histidine ammonia-lyase